MSIEDKTEYEVLEEGVMSKDDKRRYLILKDPNIYKGIILLALPVMFNNLLRTLHDVVDMWVVSLVATPDTFPIAAISITFPVVFVFISLGMGLSIAGTAIISQLVGSDQRQEARRYGTNLLMIAIVVGVILNIIGYVFAPQIILGMGAEGYVLEKSTAYLRIRSFEMVSLFVFYAFTSIRQSDGDTFTPVIFGVIAIVINIILTPIMVLVFDFGVEGAAFATLIGNTMIMPFVVYQLFFSKSGLTVSFKHFAITKLVSLDLIRTAIPASFGQSITAVGFYIMNGMILNFGETTVEAFSVGNRISSIVLHPVMAMGGVLAAYIGQNIGNANPERAKEAFRKTMIMSVLIMFVFSMAMMFGRRPIASIFLSQNQESLDLAVKYLFYLLIGLPLMAVFQTFIGAFNGTGHTKYTFIVSVTRLWVLRIPFLVLFNYFTDLGNSGIWTAMLISNFIIAFVGYFFYRKIDFDPRIALDI